MTALDGRRWDEAVTVAHHGARIGLRVAGGDAGAVVRAAVPAGAGLAEPGDADQVCSVILGPGRRPGIGGRPHQVFVGGDLVAEPVDRSDLVDELASTLDFTIAEHATERVYLHAGVVAWEGRAIVVPGRSLSGKTTLVTALVRAGATFYSDEFAPVDRDGCVWPHDRPLRIRASGSTGRGRPVPIGDLGAVPGSGAAPVGLVVHTRHEPGTDWRPVRLDPGAGLLRLLDNAVVARTKPRLALSLLAPVASSAPVLSGPRGDADEAASQILAAASRWPQGAGHGARPRATPSGPVSEPVATEPARPRRPA